MASLLTILAAETGGIVDDTIRNQIYKNFLNVKGTTAQGKFTANLNLTGDNMDAAQELLQIVWEAANTLSKSG